MLLLRRFIVFFSILIIFSGCSPRPAKLIPLRDFFRNPEQAAYRISPDGKFLASLKPYKNRMNIFVKDLAAKVEKQVTFITDRDISDYFWKGNNYLIYSRDFKGDENYHLYLTDITGKKAKDLTPFAGVRAVVIDSLIDDGNHMIIGLNKNSREVFDAYRVTIPVGNVKMIAKNPGNIVDWGTDHNGKLRLAVTIEGLKSRMLYRKNETAPFKSCMTIDFRDEFNPLFFTFDNKQIYALSNLGRDKTEIVRFDPKTGKEVEVLFSRPEVDVDGLSYSRKRKVLLTAFYTTWKSQRKFFDKLIEKQFNFVSSKLPGYEISFIDSNKNEDIYILRTHSDRTLGSLLYLRYKKQQTYKIVRYQPMAE